MASITVSHPVNLTPKAQLALMAQNVLRLESVCLQQRPWLAVMQFMQFGSLRDALRVGYIIPHIIKLIFVQSCTEKGIVLKPYEQVTICKQIADGMAFLSYQVRYYFKASRRSVLYRC